MDKLNTVAEMALVYGLEHCCQLCGDCSDAVATVEDMLRQQVVSAIGKEVGPSDLTQYMDYHCRKLLRDEFQPKGFCYAVRRPDHYPEGRVPVTVVPTIPPSSSLKDCRVQGVGF